MPSPQNYKEDDDPRFLLPQGVGICTEDVEKYRPSGFHPVHLGDRFDDGRYRIVHKLGAGGFSTVWLARDEHEERWMALKIVSAEHSTFLGDKSALSHRATSSLLAGSASRPIAEHDRQFTFDGPNSHHLCWSFPSSARQRLNCPMDSHAGSRLGWPGGSAMRLRRPSRTSTLKAYAMESDVTTANMLFSLLNFDRFEEADIYRLFGPPATGALETESGEIPGSEAPRYIVKPLDFLSSPSNIISQDIKLVDFDQCFPVSSPPEPRPATPLEFLAPEVAAGRAAGPASDVWALGCCLFRLRSGVGPFENPYQVTSPVDLMRYIVQTVGDMPCEWEQTTLWDEEGEPTKDPSKGMILWKWEDERPLKDLVYRIWDEPENRVVKTGTAGPEEEGKEQGGKTWDEERKEPFPTCFSDMVWKPMAVRVGNVYLYSYDQETLLEAIPKIPEREASLLYDLLSKIFVYEPERRPTAKEVLCHPWFHMDDGP